MGYNSTLRGEIEISPPLRWGQYKDSDFYGYDRAQGNDKGIYIVGDSEKVETLDGTLEKRTAARIEFAWPYAVKLYDVVEELQEIVDAYPDHSFTGEFEGSGANFGDIWKLVVGEDRQVRKILPTITWPDGSVLDNPHH